MSSYSEYGGSPLLNLEEALHLHARASANFDHIKSRIRNAGERPSLKAIYLGDYTIDCAPPDLDLSMLIKYFNEIARAEFVAHPDLDITINSLMFYYGIDKGHTFNSSLGQSRMNIIVASLAWAAKSGADNYDATLDDSMDLWYPFMLAWFESIFPGSRFTHRARFMEAWSTSKYDLVWFGKAESGRMGKALYELARRAGATPGATFDIAGMSEEDFLREAPRMSIHFVLRQDFKMKAERRRIREEKKAQEAMFEAAGAMTLKDEDGDEQMGEDDKDAGVVAPSIPQGIDLTRVDWTSSTMQALLNVDKSIPFDPENRPKSDRTPWISLEQIKAMLGTEVDGLADRMERLLKVSSE